MGKAKKEEKTNCDGLTQEAWTKAVSDRIVALVGLTLNDLPDKPTYDYWASGVPVDDAAREWLEEEGYETEDDKGGGVWRE
jgi:hypothetical protein